MTNTTRVLKNERLQEPISLDDRRLRKTRSTPPAPDPLRSHEPLTRYLGRSQSLARPSRAVRPWRERAEQLIQQFAARGAVFTADDLRDQGLDEPDQPNQWGALFKVMQEEKVITMVGFTSSRRDGRHSSVIRQWTGAGHDGR